MSTVVAMSDRIVAHQILDLSGSATIGDFVDAIIGRALVHDEQAEPLVAADAIRLVPMFIEVNYRDGLDHVVDPVSDYLRFAASALLSASRMRFAFSRDVAMATQSPLASTTSNG